MSSSTDGALVIEAGPRGAATPWPLVAVICLAALAAGGLAPRLPLLAIPVALVALTAALIVARRARGARLGFLVVAGIVAAGSALVGALVLGLATPVTHVEESGPVVTIPAP